MIELKIEKTCCLILLRSVFSHVLSDLSDDFREHSEVFKLRSLFTVSKYLKHCLSLIYILCCD